ncbi:4a-hydroxytetrahydrobiopterin dehydratase [Streptomyces sp. NBC_01259]
MTCVRSDGEGGDSRRAGPWCALRSSGDGPAGLDSLTGKAPSGWRRVGSRVRFGITTHDAGHKLTDADFDLAARIDRIAAAHGAEPNV